MITRCLCLFFFSWAVLASAQAPEVQTARQFADGLYARGMYPLAAREYEEFLRAYPAHPEADIAYFRLGECYRQTGDRVKAERSFKSVFDRYTGSELRLKAGFRRAHLFKDAGQLDAAADLFQRVLREKPGAEIEAASLYALAEVLEQQKKFTEAAGALEQIQQKHATSEFYDHALLRLAWMRTRQARALDGKARDAEYDRALALYASVLKDPRSPRLAAEALFQTGDIHFRRKAYAQSAAAFSELLRKHGGDMRADEARVQAGWAAHNAGLFADGLRVADDALKTSKGKDRVAWLYLKANCERQLMKSAEAVSSYDSLLALSGTGEPASAARYERALTFYKAGRYQDAVRAADGLAAVASVRKDVLWLLAESHAALRQSDQAIQYYRLVVQECRGSPVACDAAYRLAHHLQQKAGYAEAARYYAQVVRDCAGTALVPKALFASAECLAQQELHAEAVRDWDSLIREYPDHALVEQALYRKGTSCVHSKRNADAMAAFRALLKRNPATALAPDAGYWLGMLLWEEKKLADAEAAYRGVLQAGPRPELERETRFHLAGVLREAGKHDEAAGLFQSLLGTETRARFSPGLFEWLSGYWLQKEDFAKAVQAATLLADEKMAPAWREIGWVLAGRAHRAAGEDDKATDAYRKALDLAAGTRFTAEAALRLGELLLEADRAGEAMPFLEKAARLASDETLAGIRAYAYAGLGHAARALGKHEDAARYFMSVAILYEDEALVSECLYEAAAAFVQDGKQDEALKAIAELQERHAGGAWARKAAADFAGLLKPAPPQSVEGNTDP